MKRPAWIWIIVAAAVLAAGLMVGRGATRRSSAAPSAASAGRTRPAPTVAVGHPRETTISRTLQLTASISSLNQAVITSKASGYLLSVAARPGDYVRAGQVVAEVDHAQLDAQVAQAQATLTAAESAVQTAQAQLAAVRAQRVNAEAGLASARAGSVRAQAQLADMQSTYDRAAELAKQGAIAAQSLDDAKAQVVSAKAGVDAAQAQVQQAQAQIDAARQQEAAAASQIKTQQAQAATQAAALQNARLALANSTIYAPFSGIVVSRSLDPGAYVAPGSSTPILTIAELDTLDVLVPVGEPDLPSVHPGARVQVQVDAYPGRAFNGVVNRIAGGVDPTTRTAQVEIDIPNPGHPLRPGMYATARVATGAQEALVIPLSALQILGTQHYVWVIESGKASRREVTVGSAIGQEVQVTGGVTARDEIVVRGADIVREGQPVHAVAAP